MELHKAITAFSPKNTADANPKLCVYDIRILDQGYVLCVPANSASSTFMDRIRNLAKARQLEIKRFRDFYIIHSLGLWVLQEN